MKTIELTCAQAIMKFLKNQYVIKNGKEVKYFAGSMGIFGHGNVAGLGEAISDVVDVDFPFIQSKNEQAMVHTAIAYSKSLNRKRAWICTTSVGPGATNMITGAATATTNRLPVLLLPSDVFSTRVANPVLQQLENSQNFDMSVNDCFKPVSKFWDRIHRPEQILTSLPQAVRTLLDPAETGAVIICLPQDVQTEKYVYPTQFFEKKVHRSHRVRASEDQIRGLIKEIEKSEFPLIIAGGGVHYSEATKELSAFCEKFQIACAFTQAGTGALRFDHKFSLGSIGTTGNLSANELAKKADLIIGLGCRYSDFTTASMSQFQNDNVNFVNINMNATDAFKMGAIGIVADIKETLKSCLTHEPKVKNEIYISFIDELKNKWITEYEELTHPKRNSGSLWHQVELIKTLNQFCDEKSTIVHAAGGLPGDLHKMWKSKDLKDYHSEYAFSCMGYEIAGALGVKMANPEREVYAIVGDGSYLMLNHELITSIQEQKKITVILVNNFGYQCIHNLQLGCGSRSFGNEFRKRKVELDGENLKIDFLKNAESFGVKSFRAATSIELSRVLKLAKEEPQTCLIYTEVESNTPLKSYSWWDVPISQVSENNKVEKKYIDYKEQKQKQRFYYS